MSIISDDISRAVEILCEDDVVAIPTETVYGLAGNIYSAKAIRKIFEVKQRPLFNPLIVHLHSMEQMEEITTDFPDKARQLAEAFWPGPLTLILQKQPQISDLVTAGKDSVAVRIPKHSVALQLLRALPFPVAAPSANPFNRISPTTALHVENSFGERIRMVLDGGPCQDGLESTIVGFDKGEPEILRLGSISIEAIEKVVGHVAVRNQKEKAPDAPGMLAKHYSPRTPTYLVDDVDAFLREHSGKAMGALRFTPGNTASQAKQEEVLSPSGDFKEAAANLYSALHKLDAMNLDLIVAQRLPDLGLGKTINDRLTRAAHQ